jgi:2,4-diaminopentanoate dehydrogenase
MSAEASKPRIMIYGVGQYGGLVAKLALKKGFPIVGAVNRAGKKVGQDLGRVIGLERDLGVVIEDCTAANYAAMRADIGIETTSDYLVDTFPGYERLLSAGINVLTLACESTYVEGANPELAARIDALAKANKVTFTASSLWEMSRVWSGIIATSPCTDIFSLRHTSATNVITGGPHQIDYCNVGVSPEEFARRMSIGRCISGKFYALNVQHVLRHIGYHVTGVEEYSEPVLFDKPIDCPPLGRVIQPGECFGTRIVSTIKTREDMTATMHVELRLFYEGEIEYTRWDVDGLPGCTITVDRRDSLYASPATLFNRIPDVVAAEPGLKLFTELGLLRHTALMPNIGA